MTRSLPSLAVSLSVLGGRIFAEDTPAKSPASRPCELVYSGAPDVKHPQVQDYLIDRLKEPPRKTD